MVISSLSLVACTSIILPEAAACIGFRQQAITPANIKFFIAPYTPIDQTLRLGGKVAAFITGYVAGIKPCNSLICLAFGNPSPGLDQGGDSDHLLGVLS